VDRSREIEGRKEIKEDKEIEEKD